MKQYHRSSILVIGGAEDKVHGKEILNSFWHCAGGTSAIIGIIPKQQGNIETYFYHSHITL